MTHDGMDFLFDEMQQVEYLQQAVIEKMWDSTQSGEAKYVIDYYHHFYALMEKQQILWTRLKLMNREGLDGLLVAIEEICDALGKPSTMSVEEFHSKCRDEIKQSLSVLTGEDLDNYEGIDVDFQW